MVEDAAYGADPDRATDWRHVEYADEDRYLDRPGHVRGWGCLSWLAIFTFVGLMLFSRTLKVEKADVLAPLDDSPASLQGITELQIRGYIGLGDLIRRLQPGDDAAIRELFTGDPNDPQNQARHMAMWNHGTFGQRLQYSILANELAGPRPALEVLGRLKWDWETAKLRPSAMQLRLFSILLKLYRDYRQDKFDGPSATEPDRQLLIGKLEWYGKLALTPPKSPDIVARNRVMEPAHRLITALLSVVGVVVVCGACGLIGLVAFGFFASIGSLKVGLRPGSGSSAVYAETFALWMMGFMGASLATELWPRPQERFLLTFLVFFGSLLVLIWPVIRGIPWQHVREDIGLTWGRGGILEPLWGIPGYVLMMPMLIIGVLLTLLLIVVMVQNGGAAAAPRSPFEAQHIASHPIVDVVLRGGGWIKLQLLLLACVAAPIVEEIMFRGVLYRHLRDATGRAGWFLSFVISALWVSFVFAIIHPQGAVAVPALMGIALGCTLVREWRDSLWASMVVHALNNGLVFSILLFGAT